MSRDSSAASGPAEFLGSAMWRRGRVPIGGPWRSMQLTISEEGFTLQPRNTVVRVLMAVLLAPVVRARWDEVRAVGMVRAVLGSPRKGLLFEMRDPAQSFVFAAWRMNEAVLEAVAVHGVRVDRSPATFSPWKSASWRSR